LFLCEIGLTDPSTDLKDLVLLDHSAAKALL
jgi:hypothetical protein